MKKIVLLLIITGFIAIGLMNYHFILMDNSLEILKKQSMTFEDTFVDARGSKKFKLLLKPHLIKAGIKRVLNETKEAVGK